MDYAEGRAAAEAGRITQQELLELERNVLPGSGTCGAMFTANTMSTTAEAIGMMLPRGASAAAPESTSAVSIRREMNSRLMVMTQVS